MVGGFQPVMLVFWDVTILVKTMHRLVVEASRKDAGGEIVEGWVRFEALFRFT